MCEYCETLVDNRKNLLECEYFEIYIDGNGNITEDEYCVENKINYCPMCGRKLNED